MNRLLTSLVRLVCHPNRHEEILGDLAELHDRARPTDVVSVLFYRCRVWWWGPRQWATVSLVTLAIVGAAPIAASRPQSHSFNGRDAAGIFTLEVRDRKVVAASMDGVPFPLSSISTIGRTITFHTEDLTRTLEIELMENGAIEWEGRRGTVARQTTPIPLEWARQYFAEVEEAAAADAGTLWGVDLRGPLMFVDEETRFIAANVGHTAGNLTEHDGVWTGTLPQEYNIANTAFDWAGQRWTMVEWAVPSDRYARNRLIFHELFHRVQPAIGLPMADAVNDHLATRDGRIWLRLEWRALAEALLRDGDARRSAIEDALAFRARRRSLVPDAAASENALEMNEGLAQYTGLVMSGLPRSVLADRAAIDLNQRDLQENFARSFAYGSGPAYGVLLDATGVEWRSNLEPTSDLGASLARAYRVRPNHTGAESRVAKYDGQRVIAQEQARADRAAAVQAELHARFLESPTLRVAPDASFRYSYDPNGATPLMGVGTVYPAARVSDVWGVLNVTAGGVLMQRDDRFITGVLVPVKAGDEPPLSGEGWILELADGWELVPAQSPGSWLVRRR